MATKAKIDISNLTKDDAITQLVRSGDFTYKQAEAYWKENGSAIRGGVFQAVLDFLAEADRTQADLAEYVINNGTRNEARWFGQRDAIRRLSVKVRNNPKFTEKSMSDKQAEALKAIVEGS